MNYDIIGDIHGHADKLIALLRKLGYRDHAGAWRHPDRTAIFVGDFIDRGPGQLKTIDIVRRMLDADSALAVMGNHEFNAIAWHTPDPERPGEHLRRRIEKNREQHEAFLIEAEDNPALHGELIAWFMALPLWLDLPELCVVHACWHEGYMAAIRPLLKSGKFLTPSLVQGASRRGTTEYQAVEGLLKGLEVELPAGHVFQDKEGHVRHNVRVRWWDTSANTFRKAGIMDPDSARLALPDLPVPKWALIGYDSAKPVFFGHYWRSGTHAPLARNVACVDYSAAKDGPLVAYRWEGEPELSADRFIGA